MRSRSTKLSFCACDLRGSIPIQERQCAMNKSQRSSSVDPKRTRPQFIGSQWATPREFTWRPRRWKRVREAAIAREIRWTWRAALVGEHYMRNRSTVYSRGITHAKGKINLHASKKLGWIHECTRVKKLNNASKRFLFHPVLMRNDFGALHLRWSQLDLQLLIRKVFARCTPTADGAGSQLTSL